MAENYSPTNNYSMESSHSGIYIKNEQNLNKYKFSFHYSTDYVDPNTGNTVVRPRRIYLTKNHCCIDFILTNDTDNNLILEPKR